MSCTKDKIKSFLTKPKARIKHSREEQITTEMHNASSFSGQQRFYARVLGLPRAIQAVRVATGTVSPATGTSYFGTVPVKVEDVDAALPEPNNKSFMAAQAIAAIEMHQLAFIPQNIPLQSIKVGMMVAVEYETAYQAKGGKSFQNPYIVEILQEDQAYAVSLSKKFVGHSDFGGLAAEFANGGASTVQRETPPPMPMPAPPNKSMPLSVVDKPDQFTGSVLPIDMSVSRVTSRMGTRENPFGSGTTDAHNGIDIAAPVNTPMYAIIR